MNESRQYNLMRELYAGCIGLLCDCCVQLRDDDAANDELRDNIERAVADWCEQTGWSYTRTLNKIEVFPPRTT